mgnify:CR=1 FL=1
MPKVVDVDEELLEKWNTFMNLRDDVNRALEQARNEKVIRKSLEAKVVFGNNESFNTSEFLKQFNGTLLPNVYTLNIQRHTFRLEHGDALCTDDVAYQRFRKVIRNPILLGLIKRTPFSFRQKLANGFRKKSSETKQLKSYDIMDVNAKAVENVITEVDYLIHGHTHRPEIHQVLNKQRIVLGDWREDSAWILEINEQENSSLDFKKWTY